jgi:hypothetical protein
MKNKLQKGEAVYGCLKKAPEMACEYARNEVPKRFSWGRAVALKKWF